MGSGTKGKKLGRVRAHKQWDQDQQCCEGIRDQVFRQKIKYHKLTKLGIIGQKERPPLTN